MSKRLFLDFDGTILNSQKRIYKLFAELTGAPTMSYEEYWRIKRARITQADLLRRYFGYKDEQAEDFKRQWLLKIEEPQRLTDDTLLPWVIPFLKRKHETRDCYLVTHRQNAQRARTQAENLGISPYFKGILVSEQRMKKSELIAAAVPHEPDDVLLGDTGDDIMAARELGILSVAVTWGILEKKILMEYNPTYCVETEAELDRCPIL